MKDDNAPPAQPQCQPTLTECPRCKNDMRECPAMAPPAQPQEPTEEVALWQYSSFDELDGWGGWQPVSFGDLPTFRRIMERAPNRFRLRPLYASPPRAVEPLTDEQCDRVISGMGLGYLVRDSEHNRAMLRELCKRAHNITKE